MDLTLYEIETELQAAVDTLDLVDTPEAQLELKARVEAYLTAALEKRDRFAGFLAHLEFLESAAKAEEERLRRRRQRFEKIRERLEEYAVGVIRSLGCDVDGRYPKLDGHTNALAVRRNPAAVEIISSAEVPPQYKTISVRLPDECWCWLLQHLSPELLDYVTQAIEGVDYSVDKRAIKTAIERGEEVPGADLKLGGLRLVRS